MSFFLFVRIFFTNDFGRDKWIALNAHSGRMSFLISFWIFWSIFSTGKYISSQRTHSTPVVIHFRLHATDSSNSIRFLHRNLIDGSSKDENNNWNWTHREFDSFNAFWTYFSGAFTSSKSNYCLLVCFRFSFSEILQFLMNFICFPPRWSLFNLVPCLNELSNNSESFIKYFFRFLSFKLNCIFLCIW